MAAPTAAALARVVPLTLAGGLLLLGLPQTAGSVVRVYADAWAWPAAFDTAGARDAALARVHLLKAAAWFGDSDALVEAGVLELRVAMAQRPAAPADGEAELERAAVDLASGLARAPADAKGWTALAHARLALGDWRHAVAALKTSLLIAPSDRSLSLWRSELGLQLWWALGSDERTLLYRQLALLWDAHPQALLGLARRKEYGTIITIALAQEPRKLVAFEEALARR